MPATFYLAVVKSKGYPWAYGIFLGYMAAANYCARWLRGLDQLHFDRPLRS